LLNSSLIFCMYWSVSVIVFIFGFGWRVFIVYWLSVSTSVVEEKGEGFENGIEQFKIASDLAFNLSPPVCCRKT
jgi:hypothetical protein